MHNFPTLRIGVLQSLLSLKHSVESSPLMLKHRDCPYDDDTVKVIEELFKTKVVEVKVEVPTEGHRERQIAGRKKKSGELTDDDADEVERDAMDLLTELKAMGKKIDGEVAQLDTATRLQIIRTRATLMEKLVLIRERFTNVKKVSHFQAVVISILDDLVDEDRRAEFIKRLEPHRS